MKTILSLLISLMLLPPFLQAQKNKIQGTWEGQMSDEWLEVNIRQEDNKICGYSYDYILDMPANHCKAYFEGYYDKFRDTWVLNGTGFFENSGDHVLMIMKFKPVRRAGKTVLVGSVITRSSFNSILGNERPSYVELELTSKRPKSVPGSNGPCFEPPVTKQEKSEKPKNATIKKPVPVNPPVADSKPKSKPVQPTKPPVKPSPKPKPPVLATKPPVPAKPKPVPTESVNPKASPDSVLKPKPVIPVTLDGEKRIASRKNKEMRRLVIHDKLIHLKVYDNGTVDNDTVSIYYNGRLLVDKQKLSEKPISIDLELDLKAAEHKITMYAENLGSIPPNTALVVVTAGKNRYELYSSANLEENAVLVFEYEPN